MWHSLPWAGCVWCFRVRVKHAFAPRRMVGPFIARLVKWLERQERQKKQEKKTNKITQKGQAPMAPAAAASTPTTGAGQGQQRRHSDPQVAERGTAYGAGKQKLQPLTLGIKVSSRSQYAISSRLPLAAL